jgi:hypothetical protein
MAGTLITDSEPSPQIANAAAIVASTWVNQDAAAARQWAFALPGGELRDAGIAGLLTATAATGAFDPALLDAMTSDVTRQQTVSRVVLQLARSDQARARELMNTHLTDPALRQQVEQQLTQLARLGAAGANMPRLPTINLQQLEDAR